MCTPILVHSSLGIKDFSRMICRVKFILTWILLLPRLSDGGSVTWFEPAPVKTTSDPNESLPPTNLMFNASSPATLKWSYNFTAVSIILIFLKFNGAGIASYQNGQAGDVDSKFRERFSVSFTSRSASLFISHVTAADDKAYGAFTCELIASNAEVWVRAIQVQVLVPTNITGIRGNRTVLEGNNLQLTCKVSGLPEPNITWTKEKPGNQGITSVVQEGKVLTITNINRTDAGAFTCTAYNGFGKPESLSVHVNVIYPAKIVNFTTEYLVGVGQSVTLYCEAEGNPPSNYIWTPCNKFVKGQVCDKKTLDISQVCEDANYTCKVANGHGSDTKTANVFIGGEWIKITIDISDGKYNNSSLSEEFDEEFKDVFTGHGYEKVEVRDDRIVALALKFNSTTRQTYVVTSLRDAVVNGYLGKFAVCPTCIKGASCDITLPTPTPTPTHTGSPYGSKLAIIISFSLLGGFLIGIIVGSLCCWYFNKPICIVAVIEFIRKCLFKKNQDSKEVHSNEGQDAGMEAGYCSPDTQYAAAGPKANYRASNPSSEPSVTYEVANRGSEGRRGNRAGGPREQISEYAVVDKTKKKKKGPKPGELQYAELDQLSGRGQKATMPRVSGTDTVYADIKS